jgi:hypothetical protein
MPPVGTEVLIAESTPYLEVGHPAGAQVKIYSHFTDDRGIKLAAFVDKLGLVGGVGSERIFVKIHSIEDVAKETALNAMSDASIELDSDSPLIERIYSAIAEGKIPGVKLEGAQ